jgi:hypothetical protein
MSNTETILTVREESTWTVTGDIIVRITCSGEGAFHISGRKKIGFAESELGEIGKSIRTRRVLPAKRAEKILGQLKHMMIPAGPEFEMGCDGGFTELEVGGYSGKACYRWWSDPPHGWEALDRLAQEIIELSGINARLEEKAKPNR